MLFLALAIGYGLGRRTPRDHNPLAHTRYIEGVRQLIEQQHDEALDTFISALDVNATTFETHLALGALWRRKGEGDRAIRIHQNMLRRPGLSAQQFHQAQLELALDYSKSGLLDRAEMLLRELTDAPVAEIRHQAFQELVYLYQDEGEWEKAIQQAESLCREARPGELEFWRHLQAHYYCELVEPILIKASNSLADFDPMALRLINEKLTQARRHAPAHHRALLLLAQIELHQGDAMGAFKTLEHLQIEPPYLMIALPIVEQAYERAGRIEALKALLAKIYHQQSTPSLIPSLANLIYEADGNFAALEFTERALSTHEPAFLAGLIKMLDKHTIPFVQLKPFLDRALPFLFHCEACGFEGRQFYWCCPTCKHWL